MTNETLRPPADPATESGPDQGPDGTPAPPGGRRRSLLRLLSFRNISGIYIFVVLFVVFALWTPDTFLTAGVWRTMLDAEAITAVAALAALIPLVTGVFDLSVGALVGFTGIVVAYLLVTGGLPVPGAIALALLAGGAVGLVSGVLITRARIDSFIATLGMSSVLAAGTAWLSDSEQILNLGESFSTIALTEIFGVTLPVYLMLVVAVAAWYVLERTPTGRRMYAAGFNPDGARLAGVAVSRLRMLALVAGGMVAALAGILLTARINVGDPTVGPGLLLPALTAVFLGSTQFRGGRFNVWGTLLAVYVLAVGIKGLQLVGAPGWINDLFNGVALLLAVGLAKYERTARRAGAIGRAVRFRARSAT